MRDAVTAVLAVLVIGALVVGIPIAGGILGAFMGPAAALVLVYLFIRVYREEQEDVSDGKGSHD